MFCAKSSQGHRLEMSGGWLVWARKALVTQSESITVIHALGWGDSEASWRFRIELGATPTFRVHVRRGATKTWVGVGDKVRSQEET